LQPKKIAPGACKFEKGGCLTALDARLSLTARIRPLGLVEVLFLMNFF
jgi:hypothetical protein